MKCGRCTGLMTEQLWINLNDEASQVWVEVWHCLNCGEVVDAVILENRKNLPKPTYGRARLKTANAMDVQRVGAQSNSNDNLGTTS